PRDAIARAVEAAEWTFEAGDIGEERLLGHGNAFHDDLAGDGGAQTQLTADFRRGEPGHALFEDETANFAVMRIRFRPHNKDIVDRSVGNQSFRAGEAVAAGDFLRARLHASRIGTGVRLCQPEAAYPFAAGELWQIFPPLLFRAVGLDRIHDKR